MTNNLENQVIVITGAGKGIGRACALRLASQGARVVVNNRRHAGEQQSSADRVVEEIARTGGRAVAEYSAVENRNAGDNLLACALEAFGRVDCLFANAGISESSSFCKQSLEEFRRILEINLFGTVNVLHPFFRYFCERQSGSVVISASSAGLFGGFGLPAYSTSKAAQIGLMRSLSLEGQRKNVRVNAIVPYAATQMTVDHMPEEVGQNLPPETIAPLVGWLARDDCPMNGETIICGGGRVGRARIMTGEILPMPAGYESNFITQLTESSTNRPFDDAVDHFHAFLADIGVTEID